MLQRPAIRGIVIIIGLVMVGFVVTVVMECKGWDIAWATAAWSGGDSDNVWSHGREKPWSILYEYGEVPILLMLVIAAGIVWSAHLNELPRSWIRPALVMLLTVLLGPCLLVNVLLKPFWGRPRPADIIVLGGDREYRSVCRPGGPGAGKSFPCGHCAMAFALCSMVSWYPFFPRFGVASLIGGIGYGVVMGIARVLQGGHFPTDVLWSGVLVLAVVVTLYYHVLRIPQSLQDASSP